MLDCSDRINRALAFSINEKFVGAFGSLPAFVSVHRVVATDESCDAPAADLRALDLQGFDVAVSRRGRRVASIKKAMNIDASEAAPFSHAQQRVEMFLRRVNLSVGDESHQMQSSSLLL